MKLPIQLPFKKHDDKEYYLSLLLSDEKAQATIFSQKDGKIEVIGEKEEHFHLQLEKLSDEQLLDILDKVISTAESSLPEGFQTRKTIFGVKENWIEETKIKKQYLQKLKKICDALGLTPIGFLVLAEAISHLLQLEEGAPVSAILVEDGDHEVAVSILRAGKLLETKRVPMFDSLAKTIDKALLQFTSYEILPSRIIITNAKNHEKILHELTAHQWSKSLPFLHVPQIKILPHKYDARALLFGAATQMGFEVVDKYDMPLVSMESSAPSQTHKKNEEGEKLSQDEFGFVAEQDIAHMEEESQSSEEEEMTAVDEEIEKYNQDFFSSEHETPQKDTQKHTTVKNIQHVVKTVTKKLSSLFSLIPLGTLLEKLPIIGKRKGIIFLPPALIGIMLLLFLLYIFQLKATVILHIHPKTIEKTQAVTFSTKQSTDPSKRIIALQTATTSQDGNASTPTTGKKEVGEKAKGTITIYSRLSQSKTFSSGTVLTGPNGLKFTLNKDITVASSSGDASASPATANGPVTASAIGKESNLPSGSKFTIAGFSEGDAVAKNSEAFSGGSKQEITIVSKADQAKLLESLPKKLEDKAKTDLAAKVDGNTSLLPIFLSTTIDKKSFSKNVGDEASSVSLNGTVSFTSGMYKKSDVKSLAIDLLSSDDSSMIPSKESLSYTVTDITQDDTDISAKLKIKGFLLPKVTREDIINEIAGKSFTNASDILKKLPQVNSVDILLSPGLPLPHYLPRLPKNITVEVQTNG